MSRKKSKRSRTRTGSRPPKPKPAKRLWIGLAAAVLVLASWFLWSGSFSGSAADSPKSYRIEVVRRIPHDRNAFTQGLLWHGGKIYESTGRYGESSLRRINPADGRVEASQPLDGSLFGEGLARVESELWMLTWKAETALVFDLDSLRPVRTLPYQGEGWGLCNDGRRLIMSDGSHRLTFRDLDTFQLTGQVEVLLGGLPVRSLNELECVGDRVYANVWQRNVILIIDPNRGRVLGQVDALGLLPSQEAGDADVLNGIAHDPEQGSFYLTGKLWPAMFEVRFLEN